MAWRWVHWGAGMILLFLAGVALLLLLPAVLLIALGQGIRLTADYLAHAEPPRETS